MSLSSAAVRAGLLGSMLSLVIVPGCGRDAAWHEEDGHRWRELRVRDGEAGFARVPASGSGIEFVNRLSEDSLLHNEILSHGSGVALGDADGDGRLDLYLASIEGPNALYRNLGEWRFEEVTGESGAGLAGRASRGAAFADVDGDRDPDLLVGIHGGPNVLLRNDGTGRFTAESSEAGFEAADASTTLALADVDGDTDLDLYVTNYKRKFARDLYSPRERRSLAVERSGGRVTVRPRFREHYRVFREDGEWQVYEYAEPDVLYRNDGSGRFEAVPFTGGAFLDEDGRPLERAPDDWGLAARFQDVDGDGDPDLYVCNDFESPDRFWINQGDGGFRAVPTLAVRKTSAASMAVDFADVDADGDVDLFVGDMLSRDPVRRKTQMPEMPVEPPPAGDILSRPQVNRNTVQVSRGDGTFAEAAWYADLAASEWTWGAVFLDVDLDGLQDLLVTTGHVHDFLDADTRERFATEFTGEEWRRARLLFPGLALPNLAFRNQGAGRFEPAPAAWRPGSEADISHGLARGDLDGDGDLDVVVNRLNAPPLLLRNRTGAPRVAVRLVGEGANSAGVGAVLRLRAGSLPVQRREVTAGGLYLSGSEPLSVFAGGGLEEGAGGELAVAWPDGRRSVVEGIRPNRLYEVRQAAARDSTARRPRADPTDSDAGTTGARPIFERVPLDHRHVEAPFDDFGREWLPLRPSRLGPGVSWEDVDRDGDPDLVLPSGRGGRLAVFRNDRDELRRVPLGVAEAGYDQTAALGLPGAAGEVSLLVGQSNFEAGSGAEAAGVASVVRLDAAGRASLAAGGPTVARAVVPGQPGATGPLALADLEGDGDLDLFVGSRVIPTLYPAPPTSRLFRNQAGRLVPDPEDGAAFEGLGMLSGATFTDVDADGDPDLALAPAWGPVRLFENEAGRLREVTERWGLAAHPGRWNGVAAGDLNADGLPDLVVTSWGENTERRPTPGRPLLVYWWDFDGNGTLDAVEAQPPEPGAAPLPLASLDELARGLPGLRRRFESRAAYARAPLADVLGPRLEQARVLRAETSSHSAFLNRGGRFERIPLPREAQLAPAFSVIVADFDGDGHEDVFLGQNFFATPPGVGRHDAGRSLWLRGDGSGRLEPVTAAVSGVAAYGDARGAAVADWDADRRVDLAVSQNGAATLLYRNRGARPGLRVRLVGPPGNPDAVGAALRVLYRDGRLGPSREVRAGSGYWSRDGAVQVLGLSGEPAALRVRWPGADALVEVPVAAGEREVTARWAEAARD